MTIKPRGTNKNSIAVLPFKNLSSSEENEFFCDGITEEIIHALGKIEQLKVISRSSSFFFKDTQASVAEVGKQLGVNTIVEGSVRLGGAVLRISARLVNVTSDEQLWSNTWDRKLENIFDVQDEISLAIADKLREELGHLEIADHLVEPLTASVKAYNHFLKGKHLFNQWNSEAVHKSIEEFKKATEEDKDLINGFIGLADAYSFLAVAGYGPREECWSKAIEALDTAQRIDPANAGLNFMLANQYLFTEANFSKALEYTQKSLASDPTFVESQRSISFLYTLNGDFTKARDHIFYAKSIDPLNPETRFFEANYYYRSGEFLKANQILEDLIKQNDKNLPAIILSLSIKIKKKQLEMAKEQLEKTPEEIFAPDEKLGLLTLIDISSGNVASDNLIRLKNNSEDPTAHHAHSYLFMAYAILEEFQEAFKVLNNLFVHKSSILLLGFSDPMAEIIRSTTAYTEFHKKVYPENRSLSPRTYANTGGLDDELAEEYLKRLNRFIEVEKPFLNPGISLRLLAGQTDIHPNQLSRILNERLHKNFNQFINSLRIEHFKTLISDSSNANISIIGLAYESGFNSKTVFNTAFKKQEGITPKEFQKSLMS